MVLLSRRCKRSEKKWESLITSSHVQFGEQTHLKLHVEMFGRLNRAEGKQQENSIKMHLL